MQALFDFVIVAFAIFMAVKAINRLRRRDEKAQPAPPPAPTKDQILLQEIRDLLKQKTS